MICLLFLLVTVWPSLAQNGTNEVSFEDVLKVSQVYYNPNVTDYALLKHDLFRGLTFVAAKDHVLAFDESSSFVGMATLPATDGANSQCKADGNPEKDCHNFIKVLHVYFSAPNHTDVYACGTNAFDPVCVQMPSNDISKGGESFSGTDRCPRNPHVSGTYSWLNNRLNLLIVAIGSEGNSSKSEILVAEMKPQVRAKRVPRTLSSDSKYAGVFRVDRFVYFPLSETAIESPSTYVSRLGRICYDGDPSHDEIMSYTSATLKCAEYNELLGTYYFESEGKLFATFKMKGSSGKSAICQYDSPAIQRAFDGAFWCQIDTKWGPCPGRDPGPEPKETCMGPRNEADIYDRILKNETILPVCGGPIFETDSELGKIAVHRDFTAHTSVYKVYVANDEGKVLNLHVTPNCEEPAALHETWQVVPDNETSKTINSIDEIFGGVHILTKERFIKVIPTNIIPTTQRTYEPPETTQTSSNDLTIRTRVPPITTKKPITTQRSIGAAETVSSFLVMILTSAVFTTVSNIDLRNIL